MVCGAVVAARHFPRHKQRRQIGGSCSGGRKVSFRGVFFKSEDRVIKVSSSSAITSWGGRARLGARKDPPGMDA